jgi:dynactin complex subunit
MFGQTQKRKRKMQQQPQETLSLQRLQELFAACGALYNQMKQSSDELDSYQKQKEIYTKAETRYATLFREQQHRLSRLQALQIQLNETKKKLDQIPAVQKFAFASSPAREKARKAAEDQCGRAFNYYQLFTNLQNLKLQGIQGLQQPLQQQARDEGKSHG